MSLSNDHWPLSQYILLIGAFKATKPNGEPSNPQVAMQFIKEANAEFKFAVPDSREGKKSAWIGSDSDTLLKGPVFGIRWDHRPKNCKSFVFGSMDPECSSKSDCACDFALAPDNQASCISRNQIAIGLYPQQHARKTATVKLTCLNGPVWISRPSQKDQTNKTEQYSLPRGKTEPVDSCIRVCLTTLEFQVWIPGLTKAEAKERNSLASAFERECASLMPARLPNITGAMDTVCDNVRNVATKRLCIYESRNPPHNTLDKPFFVIRYGGEKKWAWQPYRTEEETKESLAQKEKTIHSMWETSVKIGIHRNIYRFIDIAAYRARGFESTFDNKPWIIGDELEGTTKTLPRYFEGIPTNKFVASNQGSFIFRDLCNAMYYAHDTRGMAHGYLNANHVLLTKTKNNMLEVRIYGFDAVAEADVVRRDDIALGKIGVWLLAGLDRQQLPGNEEGRSWITAAEKSPAKVRKMLQDLLCERSSAEHAFHIVSGILLVDGLIPMPGSSKKRKAMNPPTTAFRRGPPSKLAERSTVDQLPTGNIVPLKPAPARPGHVRFEEDRPQAAEVMSE